jgi:hypothetical protein
MRFSSVFHTRAPSAQDRPEDSPVRVQAPPAASPPAELPDDLDARVRLVGEWQVFEH